MPELFPITLFTLGVAVLSTLLILPPGVALGWLLARRNWRGKVLVETFVALPLVIPPVATGLILLKLFGKHGPLGVLCQNVFGVEIVFTWKAVVIATAVMAFPLLVRAARVAFEEVPERLEHVARTLGAGPWRTFFMVSLPLARRGLAAGTVLAFARALGEFGATVMIAGMIPGETVTLALGIYQEVQLGNDSAALGLLGVSVALAFGALALSEWILRRKTGGRDAAERGPQPLSASDVGCNRREDFTAKHAESAENKSAERLRRPATAEQSGKWGRDAAPRRPADMAGVNPAPPSEGSAGSKFVSPSGGAAAVAFTPPSAGSVGALGPRDRKASVAFTPPSAGSVGEFGGGVANPAPWHSPLSYSWQYYCKRTFRRNVPTLDGGAAPIPAGTKACATLTLAGVRWSAGEFSLEISATFGGRVTGLFGVSGSGKSTLVELVAGFRKPQAGRILLGDEVLDDGVEGVHLAPERRRIGFVPQDGALFPHLTVEGNLRFAERRAPVEGRAARRAQVCDLLGIGALLGRAVGGLSGGERQRVALARALVSAPRLLLLDEPLAALDAARKEAILPHLRRVRDALGIPILFVSHAREEVLALCDQLAVLAAGRLLQHGPVAEVFRRPANDAVARIVGVETVLPGRLLGGEGLLAAVEVAGVRLFGLADRLPAATEAVLVSIRSEDVLLLRAESVATASARNRWPATVVAIIDEGALVRVELDCGFPLVARLTRQAAAEFALAPGGKVVALVKAPNVHLIAR